MTATLPAPLADATPVELMPCPFCDPLKMTLIGSPKVMAFGNETEASGVEHWHGLCVACGAEGPKEATMAAAIAAWNRRAALTPDDLRHLAVTFAGLWHRIQSMPAGETPELLALCDRRNAILAAVRTGNPETIRAALR